jgi:oligopeptide/dipeptide ABC transporter ATP-binding protein
VLAPGLIGPVNAVLLQVENLVKHYGRHSAIVHAVDGVTLDIRRGETVSLVGETGCGKTTVARCITRLTDVTSGRIVFDGEDITRSSRAALRAVRRRMQMVFQDPHGSLNPRHSIGASIGEPLAIHGVASGAGLEQRVRELMELVGLDAEHASRRPAEFSGGQLQRVSIARAIALRPDLIVCDEPVSALDVSVRAQILNLLAELQDRFGMTYLFISHDLSVVRHVSDRVAVMYLGKIVEVAPVAELFALPQHPYTKALIDAAPSPDPDVAETRLAAAMHGDPPSPINPPGGCRFHPGCAYAQPKCALVEPLLASRSGSGTRAVACHFPLNG